MMKRITLILVALSVLTAAHAATKIEVKVTTTRFQHVTGFGAACCDGAMCPHGDDTRPIQLLYGTQSAIGLNIMRMEISPNFKGDISYSDVGWDTPYDWKGSLPSAKLVKKRGGIVFGSPWSPPGEYKTNGTAQGGKVNDKNDNDPQNKRGALREDCYELFFPWFNTFLKYMKQNGVNVDAVSIQNEPDWWVNYSGCLYTPEQQLKLVKNYAHLLDRETYNGVKLISAEPYAYNPEYSNKLMNDAVAREQIDIVGGHIYGSPPLKNLRESAKLAMKYGKEVWMTENSVSDKVESLPNWHEQLKFAETVNECMLAGCSAYIYWYMRAHWAFVGTGETKYNVGNMKNTKNALLPRAYVMSHFSKNVTGSTRLGVSKSGVTNSDGGPWEVSAYIKGDSLIVMAIDTTKNAYDLALTLPYAVKSGKRIISTSNESLCKEEPVDIASPVTQLTLTLPARSLNTFVFQIDQGSTAIEERRQTRDDNQEKTYYNLQGRRLQTPKGLCIEKSADGSSRKVLF
jgi:glucuronoarabinoxylan endo-1,4-beta-xylanase